LLHTIELELSSPDPDSLRADQRLRTTEHTNSTIKENKLQGSSDDGMVSIKTESSVGSQGSMKTRMPLTPVKKNRTDMIIESIETFNFTNAFPGLLKDGGDAEVECFSGSGKIKLTRASSICSDSGLGPEKSSQDAYVLVERLDYSPSIANNTSPRKKRKTSQVMDEDNEEFESPRTRSLRAKRIKSEPS